jgi:hypothetical protein
MSLEAWWPLLRQESRDWLVANNGATLDPPVLDDLVRVGGSLPAGAWWLHDSGPDGFQLSDAGVDWVEAVANGEHPEPPPGH